MSARIQFGSLQKSANEISNSSGGSYPAYSSAANAGVSFDSLGGTQSSQQQQQEAQLSRAQLEIMEELERRRRAKTIAVPTDDLKVRQLLREIKEPMTLFGEGPYERRERLRHILSIREDIPHKLIMRIGTGADTVESDEDDDEEFFVPGVEELEEARMLIAQYSIERSKRRLESQREEQKIPMLEARENKKKVYKHKNSFELCATQVGSERPLTTCAFSPDSSMIATGCLGGSVAVWSIPNCDLVKKYKGHAERVGGISWHPSPSSPASVNFASGGGDGSVYLWNLEDEDPVMQLGGHALRVSSTAFHPSGLYLGTAGYDLSWRMWDMTTGQELLLQEGHSREVYTIRFQWDGALAATGGLDCYGRIWDLRTGRALMLLTGHIQPVHSIDWNPNSFEVLTASADHSIRVHDIRNLKTNLHAIPAHGNLVSSVRFGYKPLKTHSNTNDMDTKDSSYGGYPDQESYNGSYFVSASFDKTARIWGTGDHKCLSTLAGHENRIMDMDLSRDEKFIATASYDRTFKLWACDETSI